MEGVCQVEGTANSQISGNCPEQIRAFPLLALPEAFLQTRVKHSSKFSFTCRSGLLLMAWVGWQVVAAECQRRLKRFGKTSEKFSRAKKLFIFSTKIKLSWESALSGSRMNARLLLSKSSEASASSLFCLEMVGDLLQDLREKGEERIASVLYDRVSLFNLAFKHSSSEMGKHKHCFFLAPMESQLWKPKTSDL